MVDGDYVYDAGSTGCWRWWGQIHIPRHEWSHIAVQYDGTNEKHYVNGMLAETGTYQTHATFDRGSASSHVRAGCRRLVPRRPLRAPGAQQEPAEPPAHRRAWVIQLRGRRPQQLHAEQPVIPVPRRYRRGCSLLRGRADPVALGCRHRLPCATAAAAQPCLHHRLTLCWMCQCTPGRTAGAEGTDLGAQNVVYRPVLATRREGIHLQSCVWHPFCQCILH